MANDNKGLTPMMRQFFEMKSKHPEALLLFRCGDFYETYCEDAVEASRILGITLTRRNNGGSTGTTEMAGFPHHALDTYLPKLIRAGKRCLCFFDTVRRIICFVIRKIKTCCIYVGIINLCVDPPDHTVHHSRIIRKDGVYDCDDHCK